jgi:membrane protein implicated in regulation of membrane protease activity
VFETLALPAIAMSVIAVCICAPATLWLWRRALRRRLFPKANHRRREGLRW